MPPYDVAVVGAGPAGSAAAVTLALAGRRVVVLERAALPRPKTCGGGVLPRALAAWPGPLSLAPERTAHRAELHLAPEGLAFGVERVSALAHLFMRERFDHALLESARGAGAEVVEECRFDDLVPADGALTLRTSRGEFRARFVLGADGSRGTVALRAGWPAPHGGIPALECETEVDGATLERLADAIRFDVGRPAGGYGWVFPKRGHLSVGVLVMRRRRAGLREALRAYLAQLGIVARGELAAQGCPIPIRPRSGGLARGRVLIAGDAAGLVDPVTGEGISHAIRSGLAAGAALVRAEEDPRIAAVEYAKALRADMLPELRAARVLAWLLYSAPRLRSFVFRTCGAELCAAILGVIEDRRTYRGLLRDLPGCARVVWSVLSRPAGAGRTPR